MVWNHKVFIKLASSCEKARGTDSDHMIGDYSETADDCVFRFLADPPAFTTARGASLALRLA